MKKIFSALLIFALLMCGTLALVACGDSSEGTSNDTSADTRKNPCKSCADGEYVAEVIKTPTAFEDGVTVYTCNKCSDSYEEISPATGVMKILVIGDSSTSTAIGYVDEILLANGIESVVIGTANCNHSTGASIDNHLTNIKNNKTAYTYTTITNGTSGEPQYQQTLSDVLTFEAWDYVVIGQSVPDSGIAQSYANIDDYLAFLKDNAPKNAKILWNMAWAYNKDSTHKGFDEYGNDQAAMYNGIVTNLLTFVSENESVDGILPVGSAIQNLRGTFFNGQITSASGITLGTELGSYITAVTWCSELLGKDAAELSSSLEIAELEKYTDIIGSAIASAIKNPTVITVPEIKSIKLLAFGNSYSNDAITYLTHIFLSAGYHEVVIGSVMDGGCDINHHWWNIDDTLEDYHPAAEYNGMTGIEGTAGCSIRVNGVTKSVSGDTLKQRYINTISAHDWDYVTIQHGPNTVEKTETYSYLTNLIEFIESHLTSVDTKFVYHMIWKYNDTQSTVTQRTSYQYQNILDITHNIVLKNAQFENRVIPAVTFRQNMTSSFLEDVDISRDYGHMGLTLGRYALGLLWYCYLTGGSVDDVSFVPTKDNVDPTEIEKYKASHGHTHIEITKADMLVVKEAIENALKSPYEVTQSKYTTRPSV